MANKVTIFITNSKGKHFELSNEKMAIGIAKDYLGVNWEVVFPGKKIGPYDVIISDFHNPYNVSFGMGYRLVEHCENEEEGGKIVQKCREKLKKQYERMMELRVAKKYGFEDSVLDNLALEYYSSSNYEVVLPLKD